MVRAKKCYCPLLFDEDDAVDDIDEGWVLLRFVSQYSLQEMGILFACVKTGPVSLSPSSVNVLLQDVIATNCSGDIIRDSIGINAIMKGGKEVTSIIKMMK